MFRAIISSILRSTMLCLQLVVYSTDGAACWWGGTEVPPHPCHQQAASPVHHTTSCKHSSVLLRMSEIIAWNMLSWLKLLIKLLLLHLVGCLYYCPFSCCPGIFCRDWRKSLKSLFSITGLRDEIRTRETGCQPLEHDTQLYRQDIVPRLTQHLVYKKIVTK